MRFQYKLLLVALAILIFTLMLSSLLSLASFEKIFSSSLVATYEVSGKVLQRKIHTAIRLGKPLSMFAAMDELMHEVQRSDANLGRIDVLAPDKALLYTTSADPRGQVSPYAAEYPDFAGADESKVFTRLIRGQYVTFLPLRDRSKAIVGYLNLEFPREVVYLRVAEMAWQNLASLSVVILLAVVSLVVLIRVIVFRPIHREVNEIIAQSNKGSNEGPGDETGGPPMPGLADDQELAARDEFDGLKQALAQVATAAHCALAMPPDPAAARAALHDDLHALREALDDWEARPGAAADDLSSIREGLEGLERRLKGATAAQGGANVQA